MSTRPDRTAAAPPCPEGGPEHGEPTVAVRQGRADFADVYPHLSMARGTITGVSDVGYRCLECGHEWGFEVLTDDYLDAVEKLTGGRTPDHQERAARTIGQWHGVPSGPAPETS